VEDRSASAGEAQPAGGAAERLAVLKMLEDGKINAGQAEALLRALEDEG
jgi:hypothetical protein